MMKRILATLAAASLAVSAFAQGDLTAAEVRKVDKARGKITLRHGEIKNLDMPPMTMVFGVKDKAMLDKVKAGDKIRFAADKDAAGDMFVTRLEAQK